MDQPKIAAFFIYDEDIKCSNNKMSDEEKQAEKVLYYYPNERNEHEKVAHTSLLEGISGFVSQFSQSHIDYIVTKDNLVVIEKWYKSVYVVIIIRNVYTNTTMELLICKLLKAILKNFISIFNLLHGHIKHFLKYKEESINDKDNSQKEALQTILDDYLFTYINTINNENISIHNELQSFHFFPIEKHAYISVQNLISTIILDHKQIKHGGFFYEGYLIYSSLPMLDIKIIYNYLVSYNGLVNNWKLNEFPFKKIASSVAINTNGGLSSFARCNSVEENNGYLLGIKKSSVFMPIISLTDEKKYKLVVFIFKGILLMLLIEGDKIEDDDFDVLVDVQNKCTNENAKEIYNLTKINEDLMKQFKKHQNQEDSFRFFYYNGTNNSVKQSLNNKKITSDELYVVADFHFLFSGSEEKYDTHNSKKMEHIENNKDDKNTVVITNNGTGDLLSSTTHSQDKMKESAETCKEIDEVNNEKEEEEEEEKKKEESIKENIENEETDKNQKKPKLKLICNPKLQKKLLEDISDDVKIEKIYYKEPNSPWVYGQKKLDRELFLFVDEVKTSFTKAQQEINKILDSKFANIYK